MPSGLKPALDKRMVRKPLWALAREYTEDAVKTIAHLMRDGESEAIRLQAADKLLDRAWGKAPILIASDDQPALRIDIRELDGERMDQLEAALMGAITAPVATHSQTPGIIEGAIVPGDSQTPVSGLDKALTKGERISTEPEFALCSQDDRQLAYERQLSEPVLQGGGEGTSDRAEHELSADRGEA